MTLGFYSLFLNIRTSGVRTYSVIWLLHGWCDVKLLPSWRTFCVYHTNVHEFNVQRVIIFRYFKDAPTSADMQSITAPAAISSGTNAADQAIFCLLYAVLLYARADTRTHARTHARTHTHTHERTYAHTHARTHACMHTRTEREREREYQ